MNNSNRKSMYSLATKVTEKHGKKRKRMIFQKIFLPLFEKFREFQSVPWQKRLLFTV
jgi:hypothetical protein